MPKITKNGQLTQVESNIYYIDFLRMNGLSGSGVYLIMGDGLTLIETGTTLVVERVLEAVYEMGFQDKDVRRTILTHIHLDHAGATGWLVKRLPHMQVYVHDRGLKHLNNPSRLIESAKILYGNLDNIKILHGEILPVPAKNLIPVTDEELDVGGVCLKIFDAPGHAPHHLGIFEPESGCLFAGEALGHYHPEAKVLSPAVTPPGFDFEASKNTMEKMKALRPRTICFSQYGQHPDPDFVIEQSKRQLDFLHGFIKTRLDRGLSTEAILQDIAETRKSGIESTDNIPLSAVLGFQTYFRRLKP